MSRNERPHMGRARASSFVPHIVHLLLHVLLLAASIGLSGIVDHWLWWTLMSCLCGTAMVQIGFSGHDVEHGQIVRHAALKRWLNLLCWNLLLGLSARWWQEKHSAHHRDTHVVGADPDLYALYAFDMAQAKQSTGLHRQFVKHQHWLFWISLLVARLYFQWLSLAYLVKRTRDGRWLELGLILLHHIGFWLAVYAALPHNVLAFVVLSYGIAGAYMGVAFCTNHLGMPLATASRSGRHWQIAHTRNISTGPIGNYLCGGLNYQIEHHLRPSLSRFQLHKTVESTRRLCLDSGLPYHEQRLSTALRDIHASFRKIAIGMRA